MLRKLFSLKISLLYIVISTVIISSIFLVINRKVGGTSTRTDTSDVINVVPERATSSCGETPLRLQGFQYIKPIVNEERDCESSKYAYLKYNLKNFIDNQTKSGNLTSASVYIKSLGPGEDWTSVYSNLEYHPASLGKVPILITYLKKAETIPGMLDMTIAYAKDSKQMPNQHYTAASIKPGQKYKIRELLYYMIANSDNHATSLLQDNIDFASYKKTFTDLGISEQKFVDTNYKFKVKEFSIFLEALYNAGYLNITSSEYASSLLAQCKFKDGILKLLPPNVKAIHKFGEWEDGTNRELHESAIIYLNNNTYLITIMTRGSDYTKLSDIIGQLSKMVYDHMTTSA